MRYSVDPREDKEGILTKATVTGGAGFIGSFLVDRLVDLGLDVTVIDNLSGGSSSFRNIKNSGSAKVSLLEIDCKKDSLESIKGSDIIFHLAGNPEVRVGSTNTTVDFNENILSTFKVLEASREYKVPNFVFTSTSTVYGEVFKLPTPEDYSPLVPISTYGGSKLACEAMISSFSHMFRIHSTIYRFANVTGPSTRHGVVFDFVGKLKQNPSRLEILGDGTQRKSYIDVVDCVDAMLFYNISGRQYLVQGSSSPLFDVFNIGSLDTIDVLSIAKIVTKEMGLDPEIVLTGGVDGGRGWPGDVKMMRLDISKFMKMGWKPRFSSAEAITRAARSLIDEYHEEEDSTTASVATQKPAIRV
jgi:UDP-glucose 4-epimerase